MAFLYTTLTRFFLKKKRLAEYIQSLINKWGFAPRSPHELYTWTTHTASSNFKLNQDIPAHADFNSYLKESSAELWRIPTNARHSPSNVHMELPLRTRVSPFILCQGLVYMDRHKAVPTTELNGEPPAHRKAPYVLQHSQEYPTGFN